MNSTADTLKGKSSMSCTPPDSISLLNFKEPESNATSPDGNQTHNSEKKKKSKVKNPQPLNSKTVLEHVC